MSKKVRRVKRGDGEQRRQAVAKNRKQIGGVGVTPARRPRGRNRNVRISIEELKEEYAYVIKDLRRIFILALVMFALLVVANLFLPPLF